MQTPSSSSRPRVVVLRFAPFGLAAVSFCVPDSRRQISRAWVEQPERARRAAEKLARRVSAELRILGRA